MLAAYLGLYGSPTKEALADDLAQAFSDGVLSPIERSVRAPCVTPRHMGQRSREPASGAGSRTLGR
jgi:hypothetical protein